MPSREYKPWPVGGPEGCRHLFVLEAVPRNIPVKGVVFSTYLQAPVPCEADPYIHIRGDQREVSEHVGPNGDIWPGGCGQGDGCECQYPADQSSFHFVHGFFWGQKKRIKARDPVRNYKI